MQECWNELGNVQQSFSTSCECLSLIPLNRVALEEEVISASQCFCYGSGYILSLWLNWEIKVRQGYKEQIEGNPDFSVGVRRHSETSLHWYYRHAEC